MCDQQRLRPACAYARSDQSICKSLEYYMNVQLLAKHPLEFLSLKGGCTGWSESTLVKMPHCWKSHVTAQMPLLCANLIITNRPSLLYIILSSHLRIGLDARKPVFRTFHIMLIPACSATETK